MAARAATAKGGRAIARRAPKLSVSAPSLAVVVVVVAAIVAAAVVAVIIIIIVVISPIAIVVVVVVPAATAPMNEKEAETGQK